MHGPLCVWPPERMVTCSNTVHGFVCLCLCLFIMFCVLLSVQKACTHFCAQMVTTVILSCLLWIKACKAKHKHVCLRVCVHVQVHVPTCEDTFSCSSVHAFAQEEVSFYLAVVCASSMQLKRGF